MDPRLARMAALKQEKEARERAQASESQTAGSHEGSGDSHSALHSLDELASSQSNDVDGTELPQTAPVPVSVADDEDDVDGEEDVADDADAEGDVDEDDDVDGEEQTQETQEGEQEQEVKPAETTATSEANGDSTQEAGPSTVAATDGLQEGQTGGADGDDDADGEAMEESEGEEVTAPQQQEQPDQTQPQEQTVTPAVVEPTSEVIKAEAAVSPPQPDVDSKTAPLQPLSQKAEARDQVDAFLAQIQAQQTNGAFQSSSAPQPDLSTPAARRAHLLARLEKEPRDSEAWLTLLADSEARLADGDPSWTIDDVRSTYDKFLEVYPSAARQWLAYIDLELSLSNFQQVEALFTRCLRSTPSVSLWKSYLSYTRRVNPLPAPSGSGDEEGERGRVRRLIEEAYEFATRHVGMSRDAGEIWGEYIKFIKDREAKTPWQSGQKMDDLRKIYQRVVGIPLANVEAIWREYDQFENGLNRVTAKKFLAERSAAYMTARSALREMRHLVDHLHRPLLPRLPAWVTTATAPPPTSSDLSRDRERLEAWKAYLQWEESDPLELGEGEGASGTSEVLRKRIEVAYAKATMHMRFNSEIWWMASRWAESCGRTEESVQWLKDGMKACPGSYLLSFAYTESCETRGATSDCSAVFEALLSHTHSQIEALEGELEASLSSIDASAAAARAQVLAAKRDAGDADELEGEEREEERKLEEARDAQKEALRATMKPRIDSLKEEASLVWIRWMHFVRRTEGLRPTRAIFSKARRSPHVTWQIYEASALMEYHCSKDANVATKVFELALKTFGSDEAFVVRYLDFLISINDENNARSLFERTLPSFPPSRARPLWSRWASYEYTFGDSTSIRKLEARLAEMYPEESPLKRLRDRSAYGDLEVVGLRDLGEERLGEKGGATAAERAVLAANNEVAAPVSAVSAAAAGDAAITAKAVAAAAALSTKQRDEGNNDLKRGREAGGAGEDGANKRRGLGATPPSGPAAGSRSSLPPQGAVFPSAGTGGPSNGFQQQQQQQQQQFGTPPPLPSLADGILYFLSLLPNARAFDGPRLPAEQVMEAVRSSNIAAPAPGPGPGAAMGGPGGPNMAPAGPAAGWAAGRGAGVGVGVVPPLGPSGRGGGVVGRGGRRRF